VGYRIAVPFRGRRARLDRLLHLELPERFRVPLLAFATSRLVFLVAGVFGAHVVRQVPRGDPFEPPGALGSWAHWDGAWYLTIAREGYHGRYWPPSANFFPGYPTIVRILAWPFGHVTIVAVCVSLVCCALALFFFHELAVDAVGREAGTAATFALAFFPTAFFLNAAYTEPAFLAFATGSLWAARFRRNFLLAGILGGLAAATRNIGVFLLVPLLDEWWRRRRDLGIRQAAALVLVPAGLGAYMLYLRIRTGDALIFAAQSRDIWGRRWASPVYTFERAWDFASAHATWSVHPWRVLASTSVEPGYNAMDLYNLVLTLLLLLLVAGTFLFLSRGLAVYALLATLAPLLQPASFSPLAGMPRYALAAFPAFFVLGLVLARSRVLLAGWLVVSAAWGVLLTLFFTSWRWVS
jgi:mannosyltransferase PIG-V